MLEKPHSVVSEELRAALQHEGIGIGEDNVVYWLEDAAAHPKNWSLPRKLYDTGIICVFVTISTMVGNGGNSVAELAAVDLGISTLISNVVFAALFYYGQAIGSLTIPPYSETFGRKTTNLGSSLGSAIMCATSGIASPAAVAISRFICGFLSAVPAVVGAGSVEDIWDMKPRIWAIDFWVKSAIVGNALGPLFGVYITTSNLRWPWVFHLGAIITATSCLGFLFTKESRPSKILQQRLQTLQHISGSELLVIPTSDKIPSLKVFAAKMIIRPIHFFFTEPIVCTCSIMSATVFASIFLLTQGLTVAYEAFGFSSRSASLVFIAWIVGLLLTIPIRIYDWRIYSRHQAQNGSMVLPEDKLMGFYIAAPVLAASCWWWSWTVPPNAAGTSPWVSIIPVMLIGACVNEYDGVLAGYLTDSYTMYAASANAPLSFLRGVLSGTFPLFGTLMFRGLGSNISGSIVASIASVFLGIAIWFWAYARQIRESSSRAASYKEGE